MAAPAPDEFKKANYGRVAKVYSKLEALEGGFIEKARNAFLGSLPFAPENPIVVGCGPGAFPAAYVKSEKPNVLTINDIAPEMLAETKRRVSETGWTGQLVELQGDVTSLGLPRQYDFLAAQFFLNCFPQASRVRLLGELRKVMTPGAILLVSDYSKPRSPFVLPFFYLNYGSALLLFWALAKHAPNKPGNIEKAIVDSGLKIKEKRSFFFGMFSSWLVLVD